MIKIVSAAAIMTAGLLSFGVAAQAQDFNAAPINSGPPTAGVVGQVFPPAAVVMTVVNGVTQPIVQPILAPVPAAAPEEPMVHHHHHHHHHHHKM